MKALVLILSLVSTQAFASVDPNMTNDDDSLIEYIQAIDSMTVSGITITHKQLKEIREEQKRALDQLATMRSSYESLSKKSSEDAPAYNGEIAKIDKVLKDHRQ